MATKTRHPSEAPDDARVRQEWYQKLPERAQEDLKQQWAKNEEVAQVDAERRKDRFFQCVGEAAVLLFTLQLLLYGVTLWSSVVTVVLGAALGTAWSGWSCGRNLSALLGILGFLLSRMLCGMGDPFTAIIGLILVTCFSMAMAIPRESGAFGA